MYLCMKLEHVNSYTDVEFYALQDSAYFNYSAHGVHVSQIISWPNKVYVKNNAEDKRMMTVQKVMVQNGMWL